MMTDTAGDTGEWVIIGQRDPGAVIVMLPDLLNPQCNITVNRTGAVTRRWRIDVFRDLVAPGAGMIDLGSARGPDR